MSTNNERDTKFLGFAKLLYEELARNVVASDKGLSDVEAFKQEQHTIIAQRAYDLEKEIKSERIELLEQLVHDYKVFCNLQFYSAVNISGDDYLNSWKQDRDNLKLRANSLLNE